MVTLPFNPILGRQKQVDLRDFKASLLFTVNSRTARATQRSSVTKTGIWIGKNHIHVGIDNRY